MSMSELEARGPKEHDKTRHINDTIPGRHVLSVQVTETCLRGDEALDDAVAQRKG
jgi:hypothetical protein